MIAVGALAGVSLVMMQIMKSQSKMSVQAQVDQEVSTMKTEIQALFNSPASCNANLANKYGTINPSTLYKCTSGTCSSGTGTAQPQFSTTGTYSNRVRVTGIQITITPATPVSPATAVITNATIAVTIAKKLMKTAGESTQNSTATLNFYTTVISNGSTITGCPKSVNSTTPF